jgi:hypothetical protein
MRLKVICFIIFLAASAHSQRTRELAPLSMMETKSKAATLLTKSQTFLCSSAPLWLEQEPKSKKSPGLAFLYSLFVPGTGQLYANRLDVGKYFMISEATLWLGFAAFTIYGNWLFNDAESYAVTHAGINTEGKNSDFYVNIGNYDNVDQYNQDMLITGQYDKIYYPGTGYDFYWDDVANRKKFREDNLASDRIHNDRLFIVGAVLLNHIASAISALILTNKYNSEIKKDSGGLSVSAGVMKHFNRIDGMRLKATLSF